MRRRAPRTLAFATAALEEELAPASVLSRVQRVWTEAVGDAIAAEAQPAAERDGVLTVTCSSSVWAHELDLMAPMLIGQLNARLPAGAIRRLRCRAVPPRRHS